MVSEPSNARNSLVHRVLVQAPFAQDGVRQYGPRVPVLDNEARQGRITTVLSEEAVVHCGLRNGMLARESTRMR
eukprot:2158609-Alexandrium_andersonii.AAC.1